jgi:hypothetical protein
MTYSSPVLNGQKFRRSFNSASNLERGGMDEQNGQKWFPQNRIGPFSGPIFSIDAIGLDFYALRRAPCDFYRQKESMPC